MHNVAHWTCVSFGLLLIVSAIASRLQRSTTGSSVALKRVTLVLVGMVSVMYGAYRIMQ